jgi:prepilin signal peptidase PulO-like enzyme (type II secretory pathway)
MSQEFTFFILQIAHQHPVLWYIIIVLLGMLAGSFITMLCHRLPVMLQWQEPTKPSPSTEKTFNLFFPRSFCPNCQNTIKWWQNIPILSYCLLGGKCHHCHQPIAHSYLIIEIISVLLSIITALIINDPIHTLWWLLFTWIALALTILDSRYLLLPDSLNYSLLWSGMLFSIVTHNAETAIISAFVGYLSFAIINFLYKLVRKRDGIGQGDFKLLAGIAVWLSWYELPSVVLLSSIFGLCYALYLFLKHKSLNINQPIPFAPFLLFAAWLWALYLHNFY